MPLTLNGMQKVRGLLSHGTFPGAIAPQKVTQPRFIAVVHGAPAPFCSTRPMR